MCQETDDLEQELGSARARQERTLGLPARMALALYGDRFLAK
jgi:hypothetical protein